jgi:hypothetical protein
MVWRYVRSIQMRPSFTQADVVFQEWFASGCSQKNIITKIGGARNCLRLVVTGSFLWVTSWFPFSLIAPLYDMEHVIPLRSIIPAPGPFLWEAHSHCDVHHEQWCISFIETCPKEPGGLYQKPGSKDGP